MKGAFEHLKEAVEYLEFPLICPRRSLEIPRNRDLRPFSVSISSALGGGFEEYEDYYDELFEDEDADFELTSGYPGSESSTIAAGGLAHFSAWSGGSVTGALALSLALAAVSAIGSPAAHAEQSGRPYTNYGYSLVANQPRSSKDSIEHEDGCDEEGGDCAEDSPLNPMFQKLKIIEQLEDDWNGNGYQAPNAFAVGSARDALRILDEWQFAPSGIVPSGESGIGIIFRSEGKYADIEFFNSGDVMAVTQDRGARQPPHVWDVEADSSSVEAALSAIREFITA